MKYILLNKENVVVDICKKIKPVRKNRNGIVTLCSFDDAQGYIASDNETVLPKLGEQFIPSFYDVASAVAVNEVPEEVEALKYKYTDGEFVENADAYPDTNIKLTKKAKENEDALLALAEEIYK